MDDRRGRGRDRDLRDASVALERMAPVVRFGLLAVGSAVALDQIRPLVSDGQFTWGERRVIAAVTFVTLGGFAAAGWIGGQLLRAAGGLIGAVADGAEASERTARLIESQLVPRLDRAVAALERMASGPVDPRAARAAVEARRAIAEGRWSRAERLIGAFTHDHPLSLEASSLAGELAEARRGEAESLLSRLDGAMADDDAGAAITCRDELTRLIGGEELTDLDRRVVAWLARWVRRRARAGGADAPAIAALAADRFGDLDEGRALRDAVPALRRRAGLCPSCARPYRGRDEICPECAEEAAHRAVPGRSNPKGLT